ncbi:MAG: ATP synthase F1 subunit delta [Lachnospiraceae bacterium]|nr:ATP synthase F1 subunit delta [Lachnospiraceae bacterium]
MAKLVSKTYGEALFALAIEENIIEDTAAEAKGILEVLKENEDLLKFLKHPQVTKEEKEKTMENIFKGKISETMMGFLVLTVEKDRQNDLAQTLQYFLDKYMEYKKIGVVYVSSASMLSDVQKKELETKLLSITEFLELEMNYEEDPSLIGGMVIRIGDRVVDSSIRTKLAGMAKELSKVSLS